MDPTEVDWCPEKIDSLHSFLSEKNTKGFIYLKEGRIVDEVYFDDFTMDSLWYWASAGKSLTAMLVGCAQDDGELTVDDPTSMYLGEGWTSATLEQEQQITIHHQLSMTSGLDYTAEDLNCLEPECLQYLDAVGEQWYYYNAPYRLLQDVLSSATGQNFNVYTAQRLGERIGMGGLWVNYVRYGKARDMARFGLLTLNEGVWANDTILSDTEYFEDMVTASQSINEAYGYLWWLNAGEVVRIPSSTFDFQGPLIQGAPLELVCALGKNDQKIYVWPSEDVVVVRIGNASEESVAGPSSFDSQLWERLQDMSCDAVSVSENSLTSSDQAVWNSLQNPIAEVLDLSRFSQEVWFTLRDAHGRMTRDIKRGAVNDMTELPSGHYYLTIHTPNSQHTKLLIKQ